MILSNKKNSRASNGARDFYLLLKYFSDNEKLQPLRKNIQKQKKRISVYGICKFRAAFAEYFSALNSNFFGRNVFCFDTLNYALEALRVARIKLGFFAKSVKC